MSVSSVRLNPREPLCTVCALCCLCVSESVCLGGLQLCQRLCWILPGCIWHLFTWGLNIGLSHVIPHQLPVGGASDPSATPHQPREGVRGCKRLGSSYLALSDFSEWQKERGGRPRGRPLGWVELTEPAAAGDQRPALPDSGMVVSGVDDPQALFTHDIYSDLAQPNQLQQYRSQIRPRVQTRLIHGHTQTHTHTACTYLIHTPRSATMTHPTHALTTLRG